MERCWRVRQQTRPPNHCFAACSPPPHFAPLHTTSHITQPPTPAPPAPITALLPHPAPSLRSCGWFQCHSHERALWCIPDSGGAACRICTAICTCAAAACGVCCGSPPWVDCYTVSGWCGGVACGRLRAALPHVWLDWCGTWQLSALRRQLVPLTCTCTHS